MSEKPLLQEYLGETLTPEEKARRSLLHVLLNLAGYKLICDLGIAGSMVYRSPRGNILHLNRHAFTKKKTTQI
jgi:hypothetical protein